MIFQEYDVDKPTHTPPTHTHTQTDSTENNTVVAVLSMRGW